VNTRPTLSADGLLCALVIAPQAYARNRFFSWFEQPYLRAVRHRASILRGIVRQLVGIPGQDGQIVGEQSMRDGRVLLRYVVPQLNYSRTTALSSFEAAVVRYVVARARRVAPDPDDRTRVEQAVAKLAQGLP
jgi:hypothetical protein